jgi:Stage III sporulation protein AC/AD protein family.
MSEIAKLVAIALVGAVCCVMIKEQRREIGLALSMSVGMLLLAMSLSGMETALESMRTLGELAGLSSSVLLPIVKSVGIGILTNISAELCRDAGERSLAAMVEVGGSVAALLVALPLLSTVVMVITGLM